MNFEPIQITRTLTLDLGGLLHCRHAVEEVFAALTPKTIDVRRPDDPCAISVLYAQKEGGQAGAGAARRVEVGDWFACVCQRIRREDESDVGSSRPFRTPETVAWYTNNFAPTLLLWDGMARPVGPAGVSAEIVLTTDAEKKLLDGDADAFRWVVAHELTHALDFMQWVVPAFQDWDAFCQHANAFGSTADDIIEHLWHHATVLDDYGSDNELAMIERYWPGHARTWFDAYRNRTRRQPHRRRG